MMFAPTAFEQSDLKLDVEWLSQYGAKNGLGKYWQSRACGILSLKMVLDYWGHKEKAGESSVLELLELGNVLGGRNPDIGWRHSALVLMARQRGYRAWRRGWMLSLDGRTRFVAEGADDDTLGIIDAQQRAEAIPSLLSALHAGIPVIVSFSPSKRKPHLSVLTGYRLGHDGRVTGFYVNDPEALEEQDGAQMYVPLSLFLRNWYYQGIFITPRDMDL